MHVKVVAEVESTIFNFRSFIRFSLRESLPCSFTVPRHNFRITFWTKDEEKGEKKAKKRRKIQSSVRQFWGGLNCKSNRIELNELLPVHYQQQLLAIKIGCYWCSTAIRILLHRFCKVPSSICWGHTEIDGNGNGSLPSLSPCTKLMIDASRHRWQ